MSGRGFKITPSAVHEHANRTSQRGDRVSQTGSRASGAGLGGGALGTIGSGTASRQQGLVGKVQDAFSQTGSRLQNHANLLHSGATSTSQVDGDHAGHIRSIHPSGNVGTTPHAQSSGSGGSAGGGAARAVPPEAHSMGQWIHDHRQNGSIITHNPNPSGGMDTGEKLNPVKWNGTGYNPSRPGGGPGGSTWGGRVFGDGENKLPKIPAGEWNKNGYFTQQNGPNNPEWRDGRYYEFDANPTPGWHGPGKPNREEGAGGQPGRVVVGDDGSMYYSGDHYGNFTQFRPGSIPHPKPRY